MIGIFKFNILMVSDLGLNPCNFIAVFSDAKKSTRFYMLF